jgi:hypothetical protein
VVLGVDRTSKDAVDAARIKQLHPDIAVSQRLNRETRRNSIMNPQGIGIPKENNYYTIKNTGSFRPVLRGNKIKSTFLSWCWQWPCH